MLQIQSDCGVKDCVATYTFSDKHVVVLDGSNAANMFTLRRDKRVRVEYGTQLRTNLRRAK